MSPSNHNDHPEEMPPVKATGVGGGPRRSGKLIGDVPYTLEILIKKAAVDPGFKKRLLEKRAEAAKELDLELGAAEVAMLNAIPAEQLEVIIANTKVPEEARRALLGKLVGGALVAALIGVGAIHIVGRHVRGIFENVGGIIVGPDDDQSTRPGGVRPPEARPGLSEQNPSPRSQPGPPTSQSTNPGRHRGD